MSVPAFARQSERPNVIFVFADQWRGQDVGYAGNPDVVTPNIDKLASESVVFENAVSNMPVSTPYRASMLTGQYALSHGLFLNDVTLDPDIESIGKVYKRSGYNTAYIGKWHVNGNGRSNYIPESHRQGFDFYQVLECTHDYMRSAYYDNNDTKKKIWEGYDAIAQTKAAGDYIASHAGDDKPFVLFLSWGPPHNPYRQVPREYLDIYEDKDISLRPNVPEGKRQEAIHDLKGYYANITALDDCVGMLTDVIEKAGIEDNTIFVFTSDHGDMLYSQGETRKQRPYDESIMVPFILRYPRLFGERGEKSDVILSTVDIMPTLLGMSGVPVPSTVQGDDLTPVLTGKKKDRTDAALIECVTPFGEWERRSGGREYRGLRTRRYTYVRTLEGPWLLYDNEKDPYQMDNLVESEEYAKVRRKLDKTLKKKLKERNDDFLPGSEYIRQWGYKVNGHGTVEYEP